MTAPPEAASAGRALGLALVPGADRLGACCRSVPYGWRPFGAGAGRGRPGGAGAERGLRGPATTAGPLAGRWAGTSGRHGHRRRRFAVA